MIRVERVPIDEKERRKLERYQTKVNQSAGLTPDELKKFVDRQWQNFGATKLRESLIVKLEGMSHFYCVYCGYNHGEEIDHFDPKVRNPGAAFQWTNFNWSCGICNGIKLDLFELDTAGEPKLLNPVSDEETADYFVLNRDTGHLVPNAARSQPDQERARYTSQTLNLNREALAEERRKVAASFLRHLQYFARQPTDQGRDVLIEYLDPTRNLQIVVRLTVRSRNPVVALLVEGWLQNHPEARTIMLDRNWLPIA